MKMKSIGQILKLSVEYVQSKTSDVSRSEVEFFLCHVFGFSRLDLYVNFEKPVEEAELTAIRLGLQRLIRSEPLCYIEGKTEFFGTKLLIDNRVLIPRQETEYLVELLSVKIQERNPKVIWDVCTGSGCIPIALKKKFPSCHIEASDISDQALEVAIHNAKINGCDIVFRKGDLLAPFKGLKTDLLISNPPYISENDYELLPASVKQYEPKHALVAKDNGLEFYNKMAESILDFLNPGGSCWFEIGDTQAKALCRLFSNKGFRKITCHKDLQGKDRYLELNRK